MKPVRNGTQVGRRQDLSLRVSVATLDRVIFREPKTENIMLALERKATVSHDGSVRVRAQPFGGGVRILDQAHLEAIIGQVRFDSERSEREADFRILISPSKWELVRAYSLRHLAHPNDMELEALPHRELVEEFAETLSVSLQPYQYTFRPTGFVIENQPIPTDNANVQRQPTVRLYRTFEVEIVDIALCQTMLSADQLYSDEELGRLALEDLRNGGRGRANSILILPLNLVLASYLALPLDIRHQKIVIESHKIDESVLAILSEVDVPEYERT
jgi:hypothetical protein